MQCFPLYCRCNYYFPCINAVCKCLLLYLYAYKLPQTVNSFGFVYVFFFSEQEQLTMACLDALEGCAQRFPEHYKSLYRLAHFYFRSNQHRNVDKAWQLMLGEQGLFANRKHYNFFNVSNI